MASEVSALRLQLSRLEDANEDIRRERDQFCAELSKFRQVNGTLESHIQDLGIENNDLRRKLLRTENALPLPSRGNEPASTRPSVGATAFLKIIGDIDVIEVDGDSGTKDPVSLPARAKKTQTRPFVLLPFRKTAGRLTPGSSVSTRSSNFRTSSEQTNSSSTSISPSSSLVITKRRIGQVQSVPETEQNKRKKDSQGQWNSVSGRNEEPFTREPAAGSSISAMEQRHAERAHNHRVASSASSSVGESPLMHIPKRQGSITVKDVALRLTDENISKYLQGCVPLTVNTAPIPYYFSRKFICKIYGVSLSTLLAKSKDKSRDFIFPSPEINPQMPTSPGKPGLLLSCRHDMTKLTCTMFSRTIPKPAQWEYMGEYTSQLAGQLSPSAFKQQTQAMKYAWAENLLDTKIWPFYNAMRARIYLRKVGEELTVENIMAEVERITSKHTEGGHLTDQDVIEAFERGDEKIDIIRMTCVSYDHRFVEDMRARSKSRVSHSPSTTGGKGSSKRKTGKGMS